MKQRMRKSEFILDETHVDSRIWHIMFNNFFLWDMLKKEVVGSDALLKDGRFFQEQPILFFLILHTYEGSYQRRI